MLKSVFISRDLDYTSEFAALLTAAGWQVRGLSFVTLTPLPVGEIPKADWIFFASKNAVRYFFEGIEGRNPTPDPSPEGEGGRDVTDSSTSPFRGGAGGGVSQGRDETVENDDGTPSEKPTHTKASVYSTEIGRWRYLKTYAREMRKQPTEAENFMWKVLKAQRFEGLKFRRQHAIDDFIVDFINLDLRLIIEIDGSIHDFQPEYDRLRTEWLVSLGYRVVRFSNEEVLKNLPQVKVKLRQEIMLLKRQKEVPQRNPTPDPSPEGEGGRRGVRDITSPLPFRGGAGGGVSQEWLDASLLWAALGPATARELQRYVGRVDFTGTGDPDSTAAAFLPLARGKRVLFPAARHSQKSIAEILGDAITALHLAVYDNAPLTDVPLLTESVLVFTSPMNARAYFHRHPLQPGQRVVAIGRTTASALTQLGITQYVISESPEERALAETVLALR